MERYDYLTAVRCAVRVALNENFADQLEAVRNGEMERDDLYDKAYDHFFVNDSVTGNASGSFTFNTWEAEEHLCHNLELLSEAMEAFGDTCDALSKGAEWCDVTIRCYLLYDALNKELDDLLGSEE